MSTPKHFGMRDLRVGGRYLHNNGQFIRKIEVIDGDTVHWRDQTGPGRCTKKVFLRQCSGFAPDDPAPAQQPLPPSREFTVRDEANALTAFAFRNGFIEEIHSGQPSPLLTQPGFSRISDDEMRRLMIDASKKLEQLLRLKRDAPDRYEAMIRTYHTMNCQGWKRD